MGGGGRGGNNNSYKGKNSMKLPFFSLFKFILSWIVVIKI